MPLEEKRLVASVFPVCFQWSSSGLLVVFQRVPILQINTRLPLGHHWVLAPASVVPGGGGWGWGVEGWGLGVMGGMGGVTVPPVVFQCRLSFSSGIPVWGSFNKVFPVGFQCTLQVLTGSSSGIPVYTGQPVVFQWHSSVHWTNQCALAQGKGPHAPLALYTCMGKPLLKFKFKVQVQNGLFNQAITHRLIFLTKGQ